MLLTPQDVQLFFRLHRALMFFVNQRLKVIPDDVDSPDEFSALSPETRLKVRDAFLGHTDVVPGYRRPTGRGRNPAEASEVRKNVGRMIHATYLTSETWQAELHDSSLHSSHSLR
jgi:hypothetical protein